VFAIRIGLTGGKGFIGRHLADRLDDPILFEGDLTNLKDVCDFVSCCDRIYHLAGKNREQLGEILKNNIILTSNLVLASKIKSVNPEIVFASSQQVVWNSNSEYGFVKSVEEEIVKKANKWCIFRIPNVYGPGCKPFYNSVIATFCYQIYKGETVTIHDPYAKREFIYIDDLIEQFINPEFNKLKSLNGETMTIGEIQYLLTNGLGTHKKLEKCLTYYKCLVD
jgi:UDP-2-acetamido-2,6-beta-L-arabino-hexul-4-ose reductase